MEKNKMEKMASRGHKIVRLFAICFRVQVHMAVDSADDRLA